MGRSRKHHPPTQQPLLNPSTSSPSTRQRVSCRMSAFQITAIASTFLLGSLSPLLAPLSAAAQPAVLAQVTYPTLVPGSTGATVSRLQATLKLLGFYGGAVDGTYSQATQSAVAEFQSSAGIAADGITGPSTWQKLLPAPGEVGTIAASEVPAASPEPPPVSAPPDPQPPANPAEATPPILRPDVQGSAVAQLQRELQTLGYYEGAIDGTYGELTQAAVRKFQSDQQLVVDAIVGASTWDALSRALAQ
ncbi:MAG: peptidoglycan-binding domain-containing protein [Phormidesmis sp.]